MKKIRIEAGGAAFAAAACFILRAHAAAFFAAALFHELGHLAAARAAGAKIARVRLAFGGAVIELAGALPFAARRAVALAGPAASFVFAALAFPFSRTACAVSLFLGALNLLPVSTLDGAGVFVSLVEERRGAVAAEIFQRAADAAALVFSSAAAVFLLAATRFNASALVFAAGVFAGIVKKD